jgi:signal transduction histidine kinase
MKFSDILASSVHDMKNSLGMLLNSLGELLDDPRNRIADRRQASLLALQVQRANSNLVQLLSLYKLDRDQLGPDIREHNAQDFIDEIIAENTALMARLDIDLRCDCDPYATGYFDDSLVRGVLNSVIGNAQRYTKSRILLRADIEDGYLVFRVEDDGDGFPPSMLAQQATEGAGTGERTQLGLYFAAEVARLHRVDGREGSIRLANHQQLSGGCFELRLP